MKFRPILCFCLASAVLNAVAQVSADPDWKETGVPPPPSFSQDRLLSLDMPAFVSLRLGIDPATLAITADGIVRYVVVAINATGSTTAMYEGIRCATGEVKTYARNSTGRQWVAVPEPQWQALSARRPSQHALAFARQGGCDEGRPIVPTSVAAIVNALKNQPKGQFH